MILPSSCAGINQPLQLGDARARSTPLHLAAARGWTRLAEALVEAGGDRGPLLVDRWRGSSMCGRRQCGWGQHEPQPRGT